MRLGTVFSRVNYKIGRFIVENASDLPGAELKYSLDTSLPPVLEAKKQHIKGWVFSTDNMPVKAVTLISNGKIFPLSYGQTRLDVKADFVDYRSAEHSGFEGSVELEDGLLEIKVTRGNGEELIYSSYILISEAPLYDSLYNPQLNDLYAEHSMQLADRRTSYHEEPVANDFSRHAEDPRLMAFYLPQFHPIPENDKAWGKGFTEWRNVAAATPRFVGHWQPILPGELGFYDLRVDEVMNEQVSLAKKNGLYGFCFYYYWFSGKKILDTPLNTFLRHREWDFNFTICWANENWTKRWDGRDSEVIVEQKYSKDDPLKFIKDVEHILLDERYVRENDRPVLLVYRAAELDDPSRYIAAWRQYFREQHSLELHIVAVMGFETTDPRKYGFDAGLDFAPQTTFFKNQLYPGGDYPFVSMKNKLLDTRFSGSVVRYSELVKAVGQYDAFDFPTYKSVMPHWDNDARRKGSGFVFQGSTPDLYAKWLDTLLCHESKNKKAPLVFVNAWNEWAEGAVLEPTQQYGHAILNRTLEVLSKYSKNSINRKNNPLYSLKRRRGHHDIVAFHITYPQLAYEILDEIQALARSYDVIVTIDSRFSDVAARIAKKYKMISAVYTLPLRGEDAFPFAFAAGRAVQAGYVNILKLHTPNIEAPSDEMSKAYLKAIRTLLRNGPQGKSIYASDNTYIRSSCLVWVGADVYKSRIADQYTSPDDYTASKVNQPDVVAGELRGLLKQN